MVHGAPEPTLRGRDPELAAVGELLGGLQVGAGGVVVVVGSSGSGKSLLLGECAAMARRIHARVGVGASHPGDQVVELSTLLDALFDGSEPVLASTSRPALRASSEQRYWVLHDVRELLEQAALQTRVLICLDDLQWADPGTIAALRGLPARLSDLPVGWVLACRPPRQAPGLAAALERLVREGARRLDLKPLDRRSVAQVTEDWFDATPSGALLELAHAARGDPFALSELLAGLREERLVSVQGDQAALLSVQLPARMRESMRGRLARLSAPARRAGIVAASLGPSFSVAALGAMLGVTPAMMVDALEECVAAELLREQADRLAFWHDITYEAVRGAIALAARRALDRQAADVLMAEGAMPVEVALQLAASAEPGDERAVAILQEAAQQISHSDPGAAADLGLRALELAGKQDPIRASLIGGTAVWLYAAARIDQAQRFVEDALRRGLTVEQEAQVRLSVSGLAGLPSDLLAEHGRRALALPGLPSELRHRHLVQLVWNLQVGGRYREAAELLPQARDGLGPDGDQADRFALELVQGALEQTDGRLEAALRRFDRVLSEATGRRDDARLHVARMWRLSLLLHVDRAHEALDESALLIAEAQRNRQAFGLSIYEMMRARLMFAVGYPGEAIPILEERLPAEVAGTGGVIQAAAVVALGRAAIHVANSDMIGRAAELAERLVKTSTPVVQRLMRWLLAQRAMAQGDVMEAHRWLCDGGQGERLEVLHMIQASPIDEVDLVRIGLAAGDTEMVRHAIGVAERRVELNPTLVTVAGVAAHLRGLVDERVSELHCAVSLMERGPRPLALASALEDLGVAERGDRIASVAAFDRALTLYNDAGAEWDARRVRRRLRELGIRRRLVSVTRPDTGWPALTDAELTVAELVAAGLTNRQVAERLFVSSHTVNTHLRHVYTKLEISSRVELARLASARAIE